MALNLLKHRVTQNLLFWTIAASTAVFAGSAFAQQLSLEADQLTMEPPTGVSCAQVGIYLDTDAASGLNWDVLFLSLAVDADLDILVGPPLLALSDFASNSAQAGIRAPGVPVPMSNCSPSQIVNPATTGGPAVDFMRGLNDPSGRSFQSLALNPGSLAGRAITIDADGLLMTDDARHLVAILEIPLIANPRRGGRVRITFSDDNALRGISGSELAATSVAGELLIAGGPVFVNGFEGDQ